ncbi:MAG TPA: hypothetical protein VFA46_07325 [Actinomycetes bacterium]|nr:hypothetical protein [Actinomycetes bacterium]
MSVFEMTTNPRDTDSPGSELMSSPFAGADLTTMGEAGPTSTVAVASALTTPFSEALASLGESDLEAEAFAALIAEFEDDEFTEALEALVNEAAARHLASTGTWSHESGAMQLAHTELEQWLETVAAEADRQLAALEAHFGDRPVDSVSESEIDAVGGSGMEHAALDSPIDAQELFFKKLLDKAKKVVKGAVKLVKKGVKAVGKVLPTGKIFGALRKLVRPLLKRVLAKAIGKLPASLRPAARRLAGKVSGAVRKATGDSEAEDMPEAEALSSEFDEALAEAVLAPNDAAMTEALDAFEAEAAGVSTSDSAVEALDVARQRLARQLVDAQPGQPPVAEMEQFIPVVMAAMPLVKLGVKIIGRTRVVKFVAGLLANLIKPMIGPEVATPLSRHIADAGLRLLGLEAEGSDDGMLGAEALVAATEDTIREVMALPEASLEHELLVEAAVEEAFEQAAMRHFPPQVLRPDLAMAEQDDERGIWVPLPRSTRPHFRYKKYSVVQPVRITRPMAQAVTFTEGDTLEERLLDQGVTTWPVQAEIHTYELLPGGEMGHLAAFELGGESYADGALEFDELEDERPLRQPGGARTRRRPPAHGGRRPGGARRGGRRRAGTRVVRLMVKGKRLRRRPRFALKLDVTSAAPQLALHLLISERVAHKMAGDLEHKRHAQVVAAVRLLVGEPRQKAMAARLQRLLAKQGITLPEGGSAKLAAALAEAVERVVAAQLPDAAPTLATAAKDPAAGATLTFTFPFADRDALTRGEPGEPALQIRAGMHRD